MAPEVKVLPGSGRISWGQAVASSGDLRSKPGLAEPTVKEALFPQFSPSGEEYWRRNGGEWMCHHGYETNGNGALSSDGNSDPCMGIMHHPSVFLLVLPVPRVVCPGDRQPL